MGVYIREVQDGDAADAAELAVELGYACDAATMNERIAAVISTSSSAVYVACLDGVVVGWIDVTLVHHLVSGCYGEIGGLVVSPQHRGAGIGRSLVAEGERWAASHGVHRMVVRSRTTREGAHRFYIREGYAMTKTSAVFSKELRR